MFFTRVKKVTQKLCYHKALLTVEASKLKNFSFKFVQSCPNLLNVVQKMLAVKLSWKIKNNLQSVLKGKLPTGSEMLSAMVFWDPFRREGGELNVVSRPVFHR